MVNHSPLSLLNTARLSEFTSREVAGEECDALLRQLLEAQRAVTLFIDCEHSEQVQQLSQVSAFNPEREQLMLASTDDPLFNQQAAEWGVILLSRLDEGILQVHLEVKRVDESGMLCTLPGILLLVQRRQARRVKAAVDIGYRHPLFSQWDDVEVSVADISDLGIGLRIHGATLPYLQQEALLEPGQLLIEGGGQCEVGVQIKEMNWKLEEDGSHTLFLGGSFVGLSAASGALIRQYIFRREQLGGR